MHFASQIPIPRQVKFLVLILIILLVIVWSPAAADYAAAPSQPTEMANRMALAPGQISDIGLDTYTMWLSEDVDRTHGVAWGDVDGDGDLDLAAANYNQKNKVYLNNNGVLETEASWQSIEEDPTRYVAWGDIDGDGDLDLAVANSNDVTNKVYLNVDGMLQTAVYWESAESDRSRSVAWGDINGDGRLDLAVGNYSNQANRVYFNTGTTLESSPSWSSTETQDTQEVRLGDINGDGLLDLAVGNEGGLNRVHLNTGNSLSASASWSSVDSANTRGIFLGDINRDGYLDLAAGNYNQSNRVYLNINGTLETSASWLSTESERTEEIALGDFDNDGDLDLAVSGEGPSPDQVYVNSGTALETTASWTAAIDSADGILSVAWGDVDGDGDLDLAAGHTNGQNKIYESTSGGRVEEDAAWLSNESDTSWSVAWGDVDGDGDLDLAVGNLGQQNHIYRNINGRLEQTPSWSSTTVPPENTRTVAWGDVNNDGRLDLAVGNDGAPNSIYLNQGTTLETTPSWSSAVTDNTWGIAWGDIDGDGDLDLAVGNAGESLPNTEWAGEYNYIYVNNGIGLPTSPTWTSDEAEATTAVAWGDFDQDDRLDLAAANWRSPSKVYLNQNGIVQTNAFWASSEIGSARAISWADADGDGDLDLTIGFYWKPAHIYFNEQGVLSRSQGWSSLDTFRTAEVTWGDVDGDGDLDLFSAHDSESSRLYLNEAGTLQTGLGSPWFSFDTDNTKSAAWADVDGDGDLDIAAANSNSPNKVYYNRQHGEQILTSDLPQIAVGSPYSAAADRYSAATILSTPVITIPYEINSLYGGTIGRVEGQFSFDGGGSWLPAVSTAGTNSQDLLPSSGPKAGLLAHWPLDEGIGRTIDDHTSYQRGGWFYGAAPGWSPNTQLPESVGSYNLTFNGSNNRVETEDFDIPNDFSISLWVNPSSLTPTQGFLVKNTSGGGNDLIFGLYSSGQYHLNLNGQGGNFGPATTGWQHLVVVGEQSGSSTELTLYKNGSFFSQIVAPTTVGNFGGGRPWLIGADWDGDVLSDYFNGQMSDVRLYGRALSAVEIGQLATPQTHYFAWDTFASNFFGQSDNVTFRLVAYPQAATPAAGGTYQYPNTSVFPIQRPYASAVTFPFRVRGTQVQLFEETINANNVVANGIVFRQKGGVGKAELMGESSNALPFTSDNNGYLRGRGELAEGDYLFAARPVSTVYRTPPQLLFGGVDGSGRVDLVSPPVSALTAEFWLRPFGPDGTIATDGGSFTLANPDDLTLTIDGNTVQTGVNVPLGILSHVAVRWRNTDGQWRLYLNGQPAATGLLAAGATLDMATLSIGEGYNGFIDEIRLWETVRSNTQIASSFDQELTGQESGLAGYWPIQESDKAFISDYSTRSQLMTISGGALLIYKPLYTLYHTSATPTTDGLTLQPITSSGVQQLVVSADNPLVLFDLDISLEWDASNDMVFLEQLEIAVQQASETLYDVTNGQAALGDVVIFQDKERWLTADVAIKASNDVRPSATIGGVVTRPTNDQSQAGGVIANAFVPGQVRMGPSWNPFGQTATDLSQDWWQAFAHELGHYLLYLPDNYLGLNNGQFVTTDCYGSFMTNATNDEYSEFLTGSEWNTPACAQTIAAQTTGRYDWQTIGKYYPFLQEPVSPNGGPNGLPLSVTRLHVEGPAGPTDTLPSRIFELRSETNTLTSAPNAQGYLYKRQGTADLADDRILRLGNVNKTGQFLTVRGAAVGDQLCVIAAQPETRVGCELVTAVDTTITLSAVENWAPDVEITPLSVNSIKVTVDQPLGQGELPQVQLFPDYEPLNVSVVSPWSAMTSLGGGRYEAILTADFPVFAGTIRVWVDGGSPREAVVPYTLNEAFDANQFIFDANQFIFDANQFIFDADQFNYGANQFIFDANQFIFDVRQFEFGANQFIFDANRRPWGAPVSSPNRSVTIINGDDPFAETGVAFIQELAALPNLYPWLSPVGDSYRVQLLDNAPAYSRSITFQYLPRSIPDGFENPEFLAIYHSADKGATWQALPTDVDVDENFAFAAMPGSAAGIYVLVVTVPIPPAFETGWNNFGFPLQALQPLPEALAAIEGKYTAVARYDAAAVDPWQTYYVTVQAPFTNLVNTLTTLEFARAYWIYATEPATLYLNPSPSRPAEAGSKLAQASLPPAVYYGWIVPAEGFEPAVGDTISAWIDGVLCGSTEIISLDGQLAYKLMVDAQAVDGSECGTPGANVRLQVKNLFLNDRLVWDNRTANYRSLTNGNTIYLPLIRRP